MIFHVHLAGNGCCQSGIILGKNLKNPYFFTAKKNTKKRSPQNKCSLISIYYGLKRIANFIENSPSLTKAVPLCLDSVYSEEGIELINAIQMYIPNTWGHKVAKCFLNHYYSVLLFILTEKMH